MFIIPIILIVVSAVAAITIAALIVFITTLGYDL